MSNFCLHSAILASFTSLENGPPEIFKKMSQSDWADFGLDGSAATLLARPDLETATGARVATLVGVGLAVVGFAVVGLVGVDLIKLAFPVERLGVAAFFSSSYFFLAAAAGTLAVAGLVETEGFVAVAGLAPLADIGLLVAPASFPTANLPADAFPATPLVLAPETGA